MGTEQPGTPVDPTKPIQGPFGTGMSGPIFGFCPVGRDWPKESSGNPLTGRDWVRAPPEAPHRLDDTADVMRNLAYKKINAFSGIGHGFYFWNFRTDMDGPQWSYLRALELGWMPKGNLNDKVIINACDNEDSSEIRCRANRHAPEQSVHGALDYIFGVEKKSTAEYERVGNLTGDALYETADTEIDAFFQKYRYTGASCDFGGVGMLVEKSKENYTRTDDDFFYGSDDEYFRNGNMRYHGPKIWVLVVGVAVTTFVATIVFFMVAMRVSKRFNKKIRDAKAFRRISRSHNSLLRLSFALPLNPDEGEYEEIVKF